jgi:hypothetical protein
MNVMPAAITSAVEASFLSSSEGVANLPYPVSWNAPGSFARSRHSGYPKKGKKSTPPAEKLRLKLYP